MDEKMREYRESHKRCKFCSYCKRGAPAEFPEWLECQLKDKIIHHPAMPRPWCRWFEVEDYVGHQ